jgi:anti-sigma factor RsiW
MIGHLGVRVSALLDGQLSPDEEERAWAHVHACHQCRDQVEREGWVKTRLAGLCFDDGAQAPSHLKGSLLSSVASQLCLPPGEAYLVSASSDPRPRRIGLVALGGGAAGAAVMGVLALGAAPADAPTLDRRAPATSVTNQAPAGVTVHQRRAVPTP